MKKLNKYAFVRLTEAPEVYHGTKQTHEITAFSTDYVSPHSSYGWGIYFTDKLKHAQNYSAGFKHVYQVTIPEGPYITQAGMFEEQPDIVKNIWKRVEEETSKSLYSGDDFYMALSAKFGGDQQASKYLFSKGIVGLKRKMENRNYSQSYGGIDLTPEAPYNNYCIFDASSITNKIRV